MLSITVPEWLMFVFEKNSLLGLAFGMPIPLMLIGLACYRFIFIRPLLAALIVIWPNGFTVVAVGLWLNISIVKLALMWFVVAGGLLVFCLAYRC